MDVKIQAIPMPNGDFFVIEYTGKSGNRRVIVLDMGTRIAYMSARRGVLRQYQSIDLCVLSHIHEDHIGGALKYIDDIRRGLQVPKVQRWIFNANRVSQAHNSNTAAEPLSVAQANEIANYLSANYGESGWRNHVKSGDVYELDGLIMRVLSPLEVKTFDEQPCPEDVYEAAQLAVKQTDYGVKVDDFRTKTFVEDTNEDNAHSLALLLNFEGKQFLWMADAIPSIVCQSLRQMGYDEDHPMKCEYMTLSHHGSKGNTNAELLSLVDCNRFIVTGNGMNKYKLPHKETMSRVILIKGEHAQFYTTQMSPQLSCMFDVDDNRYKIEEWIDFDL